MPSNNSKYSEEMREQTAKFVIESGKSATGMYAKIYENSKISQIRVYGYT